MVRLLMGFYFLVLFPFLAFVCTLKLVCNLDKFLAMVDYLSRENDLPLCDEYSDLRSAKLQKMIFPSGVLALCAAWGNDQPKSESLRDAIPEFLRHNIVEAEVRNVY